MKTTKRGKPNGKVTDTRPRQPKKAVGHDKRVSALKKSAAPRPGPVPTAARTASNRINKRKPAYDGTPNYTPDVPNLPTPPFIADSPIQVDDDLAGAQLRELAELQSDLLRAQHVAEDKKEAAATAKKTVESKTELLLEKLRMFTHPPSLPLFDQKTESRAVTRMVQGEPIENQLDLSGEASTNAEEPEPEPEIAQA